MILLQTRVGVIVLDIVSLSVTSKVWSQHSPRTICLSSIALLNKFSGFVNMANPSNMANVYKQEELLWTQLIKFV